MNSYEFICDYCSRSFTRKYNLQNHIENFHLNSPTTCHVCHRKFGTSTGYQLHMSRGHNRKGTSFPECDLCGRIFTRRQNIVSHMNTVHLQSVSSYYRCKLCNKYFTTEWSLKRHLHQIHNPNYPSCGVCKKVFKRKDGLDAHVLTCHRRGHHMKLCTICDKSYANNRNLKRHIESTHMTKKLELREDCEEPSTSTACYVSDSDDDPEHKFICSFCNEDFHKETQLRHHVKTQHSFEAFQKYCRNSLLQQDHKTRLTKESVICDYCKTISQNLEQFKHHMKSKHRSIPSVYTCRVCCYKYYSRTTFHSHKKTCKPPNKVHSCSYCDKLFTEKASLEFHLRIFHPHTQIADSNITSTNEDIHSSKCTYCDRIYYSSKTLKRHIKLKHTSDTPVKCELCDKVSSNKYYYSMHVKLVHNNDTIVKCDYCKKQFKSKRNIRRHIEFTHLGKARYKCIICTKRCFFKEKRSLRKHIRAKHKDSNLFPQCQVCQKQFESTNSCNTHQKLLHSLYQCHICEMSFNSDSALFNHLLSEHLDHKDVYRCQKCGKVFVGKDNFIQHNKNHHDETKKSHIPTPHCIICTKDFSSRKTLKRHINKFHGEFDMTTLINYAQKGNHSIDCEECIRNFNNDKYWSIYQELKGTNDKIFKCEYCEASYKPFEYAIQRYKVRSKYKPYRNYLRTFIQENTILSELCTTEMSDDSYSESSKLHELMEAESTTCDIKMEPPEVIDVEIKSEPMSP